jgi:hypothetical protein
MGRFDDIERAVITIANATNLLRHAIEAEAQGRSIAAFYSRREQRRFIEKATS